MTVRILLFLIIFAAPFHSCTTSKNMLDNQRQSGHYRLYSFPEKTRPNNPNKERFKKLVFVSSNSIQGEIEPKVLKVPNRIGEDRVLKVGGLSAIRAYFDIFEKTYQDSVIFVDAGSFLHKENLHKKTVFLMNYLNYDVLTLGKSEFELSTNFPNYKGFLEKKLRPIRAPIVTSNLFDLKSAKALKLKGTRESHIKEVNGIKVGFVGVLDQGKLSNEMIKNIKGIYIQNPAKKIITTASHLRRRGAEVIVLLANHAIDCNSQIANDNDLSINKVNFLPRVSKHCNSESSSLYKTLKEIPPNYVDLIITSGEKSKTANFILGYPVIQNSGNAKFLSWAELFYDTQYKRIDTQKTIIHQPVQLCHSFFKESLDCFTEENFDNNELIHATFLGEKINIKPLPTY